VKLGKVIVLPAGAAHANVIWDSVTRCHFAVVLPPTVHVTVYFGDGAAPAPTGPIAPTSDTAAAPISSCLFIVSPFRFGVLDLDVAAPLQAVYRSFWRP